YVSWMKMSTGVAAIHSPERPPMMNMERNERAWSMGTVKRIDPPQSVASQLKTFTPDGSAMSMVDIMNAMPRRGSMPLWNMWWPQTMNPRPMMPVMEMTMTLYPKIGFRLNVAMRSLAMPMPGSTRMYTAGW